MFELVFQAVTRRNHSDLVRDMFGLPGLRHGVVSVAFVNASGVALVETALRAVRARIDAFIGIRNDITSAQGLKRLLPVVNRLFIVDTGSRGRIFHLKIYLARSRTAAKLLVGSANLTTGGLWNNIEASLKIEADLADDAEREAIEAIENQFNALHDQYPANVVEITTDAEIDALLADGRVTDEMIVAQPRPSSHGVDPGRDKVPSMQLALSLIQPAVPRPRRAAAGLGAGRGNRVQARAAAAANVRNGYELVWESKGLSERDLNIPSGPNTARTGSMLFKKGRMDDIDQRHFFRLEVFARLNWQRDQRPNRGHLERAEAMFRLIIKNIDYGEFQLRLSHNSDETSRAYEQLNSMTQVHWGLVAEYVRQKDLLDRTLYLYRDIMRCDHFIIEID